MKHIILLLSTISTIIAAHYLIKSGFLQIQMLFILYLVMLISCILLHLLFEAIKKLFS